MIASDQGFPQISAPIADVATGNINPAWLRLIVALWGRTGGASNLVGQGIYPGKIDVYAGSVAPTGWLVCDGSAVSRVKYKALFVAIGTSWGTGDGTTTFNLPNGTDRVLIGAGGLYALGTTGGSATRVLTVANLAAHNHLITDPGHTHVFTANPHNHAITDPTHLHTDANANGVNDVAAGVDKKSAIAGNTGSSSTGITINNTTETGTNASATTGVKVGSTGSGTAFSILPPYAAITYLIKT